MLKRLKYRLYPTKEQKLLLDKHIGAVRWIYNWGLEQKSKSWSQENKTITIFDLIYRLTNLKKEPETKWLKEVSSLALCNSLINLDRSYTNFFRRKKGFPNFKKNRGRQTFQNHQGNKIDYDKGLLYILKFRKGIKIRISHAFRGEIKTTTIIRTPSGRYYASALIETQTTEPIPPVSVESQSLGIDFGLKDLIITSDGQRFENPRVLRKNLKRLHSLSRSLSKKKGGSKNQEKARIRLARLHERIFNIRNDNLHKLSHHLVCENQATTLCIEDLSVKDMLERRKESGKNLRRSIGDAGWGELRRQLEYKCRWYGKNLRVIGRFDPSSKICNECGVINHALTLADRSWTCVCGVTHDRDINAAINIRKMAFRQQNTSSKPVSRLMVERIPRGTRKSKPVELPIEATMKQERLITMPNDFMVRKEN